MRLVISTLALTSILLTPNCTMDGEEPIDELSADSENQAGVVQTEEAYDNELPSPDRSMADGGDQPVDESTDAIVQQLPEDQQQELSQAQGLPANQEQSQFESNPTPSGSLAETDAAETGAVETTEDGIVTAEDPSVGMDNNVPSLADVAADSRMGAPEAEAPTRSARSKKSRLTQTSSDATLDPNFKYYVVQPGDTLGEIARVVYGSSRRWRELAQVNQLNDQQSIFPGDMLKYNPDATSGAFDQEFSALERQKTVVQAKETLSQIAVRVMGDASYWKLLWRWNETAIPDPHKIQPGQTLDYIAPQTLTSFFSQRKSLVPAH
jgi:nucleoid-associated protein YgaU